MRRSGRTIFISAFEPQCVANLQQIINITLFVLLVFNDLGRKLLHVIESKSSYIIHVCRKDLYLQFVAHSLDWAEVEFSKNGSYRTDPNRSTPPES